MDHDLALSQEEPGGGGAGHGVPGCTRPSGACQCPGRPCNTKWACPGAELGRIPGLSRNRTGLRRSECGGRGCGEPNSAPAQGSAGSPRGRCGKALWRRSKAAAAVHGTLDHTRASDSYPCPDNSCSTRSPSAGAQRGQAWCPCRMGSSRASSGEACQPLGGLLPQKLRPHGARGTGPLQCPGTPGRRA